MNKQVLILILANLLLTLNVLAFNISNDSTKTKKRTSFEKSIFIGYDFHNKLLLGFSGPQLMFNINNDFKIGPAYYPCLWWNYQTGEMDTKLGVGFRADYKHSIVGFNTFRVGSVWLGAVIIGCKF